MGVPASARIRNRAGSVPARPGVMAAPKSPPSTDRRIASKRTGIRSDVALSFDLPARVTISRSTSARAAACAVSGSTAGARPCGQLESTMYTDAPRHAANESAVRSQRRGLMTAEARDAG